jgi:hypothetical protein
MRETLEKFILENGGEEIGVSGDWRMQTPKRVISMKKAGDLLVSALALIELEGQNLKCLLPLGQVPGEDVAALLSDTVDLSARVDGRSTLLIRPQDDGTVVFLLASSFYLSEGMGEKINAVLLSLLDSLADLLAELMLRSDLALQNGNSTLHLFLKEQASMSIVLEKARKRASGSVAVEQTSLDIGQIQKELYDFMESLSPEERSRLEALTEELKSKDPLSIGEEEFKEELHNVVSNPHIEKAKEVTRAEDYPFLIVIYKEISSDGPIDYHYAWVVYDMEQESLNDSWHSEDVRELLPCLIITLEEGETGKYVGLFDESGHRNLFPTEGMDLEEFKKTVTPIAKKYLEE